MKIQIKFKITAFTLFLITLVFSSSIYAQTPAAEQKTPVALIGGTIHTITGPIIENGTILFDKGKIIEMGENINLLPNTKKINVEGKHVYPSMIETMSILGLTEVGAVNATSDYSEKGDFNPNVRAEVAVNPESELIPVARSNGIGIAVVRPAGGIISGKAALLKLDGWTWEEMVYKGAISMIMNWPNMRVIESPYVSISAKKQKERREENLKKIDKMFENARAYKKAKEAGQKGIPHYKFDPRLEAMIPVLNKELPLWIQAISLKQILSAIQFAEKEKVKIVLVGAKDAHLALDIIKEKKIPVIVMSIFSYLSHRYSDFDEQFSLPKKLYEAGIKFCISCGGASGIANLPYYAAKAASYGLPKEEALKSVTLYPAEIIGASHKIGSLQKGKDATLIVTNGDPLKIPTKVEKLYIQGRDIDLDSKHKRLYRKYRKKYSHMEK